MNALNWILTGALGLVMLWVLAGALIAAALAPDSATRRIYERVTDYAIRAALAPLRWVTDTLNHGAGGVLGMGIVTGWGQGPTTDGGSANPAGTMGGAFGNTVQQPSQPVQAAPPYALGLSAVLVYSSTQSPASVAANTTAEQTVTVTGLATGSVVYVSKPTTQTGLGIVGARVSAANTLALTFLNTTASAITPTAAEEYRVVEIRGPLVQSATLTPAAVAANTAVEQTFTLTPGTTAPGVTSAQVAAGLTSVGFQQGSNVPLGSAASVQQPATSGSTAPVFSGGAPMTVIVNKPTAQAGLGIGNVRVVGNNQLGITFLNATASAITPTAAQAYAFVACNGISLRQSIVQYIVDSATLASVGANTSAEQTRTVNGVAATDRAVGISKPTAQAGLGIVGVRVSAANTIAITFMNTTGSAITPTADQHYTVWIDKSLSGTSSTILAQFSASFTPASVAADTVAEQTFTGITGLVANAPVVVNVAVGDGVASNLGEGLPQGLAIVNARVSATGVLALAFANLTAAAIVPGTLQVTILQAPADFSGHVEGVDGSAVVWPYDAKAEIDALNQRGVRDAAVAYGIAAGS